MFKYKKDSQRVFYLHPLVAIILFDMRYFFNERQMPFIVTSTVSTMAEDIKINRKHAQHRCGLAFDVATRSLPKEFVDELVNVFEYKYHDYKYLSTSGIERLILVKDDHLHIAIHSKYASEVKRKLE